MVTVFETRDIMKQYAAAGCTHILRRREQKNHEKEQVMNHLNMVWQRFGGMSNAIGQLLQDVASLKEFSSNLVKMMEENAEVSTDDLNDIQMSKQ